jgi:hypothetical protein
MDPKPHDRYEEGVHNRVLETNADLVASSTPIGYSGPLPSPLPSGTPLTAVCPHRCVPSSPTPTPTTNGDPLELLIARRGPLR